MANRAQEPADLFPRVPCLVTGRLVPDTDRERIRQALARHLVDEKGHRLDELELDRGITLEREGRRILVLVDIAVRVAGRTLMILRGNPGSVVTREAGTIAAARLLEPDYVVPWAVQANLDEAALLDVRRKKAVAYGWDAIPTRARLVEMTRQWPPPALPPERVALERQILFSYETHWRMRPPEVVDGTLVYR
ncbi:type I restriction enzyme HsdR N-terminal domain-containing protein [Dissulfurirhabdus thermomarina]|uniref:Type I restriction enzyme HsdR N-terminal domain-containing protein n=1 Tax=Dissulfurirhabdus thermomarina TaxID=1765737 RepID=A0A6N9TP30_DISTH|nr:type I restriction enzyme HsdR N-terminal domain-containing protein [Dissulfurirhabdus thermomarina]NDY42818.1 type I restriction enzyme HsdR N-terminal domain-containing protein [Dissulfurirhabdus thermomarina]NMX22547.1 type I restriction enzyme HsdR N-terminal domain-containing protein [Dissulfurirhabdus thermomarina]